MPVHETISQTEKHGARPACIVARLCALLPLGLALAVCVWRPDPLAALTLVPAWCWLAAGVASAFVVWRLEFRRQAAWLLAIWVCFAVGWVEETRSLSRSIASKLRPKEIETVRGLRIVSLNCAGMARCIDDLRRVKPDVVLLQEAPGDDELARIARELYGDTGGCLAGGDTAILARGGVAPVFVDRQAHYVAAQVTLAAGPVLTCVSLRLSPPVARLDFWDRAFWKDHELLRMQHRRELREIDALLRDLKARATIVGGDFNTTPLDPALDELRSAGSDAFLSTGTGWGATGSNDWPLFRVDQIWLPRRMHARRTWTIRTRTSDHRMVVCDLEHSP